MEKPNRPQKSDNNQTEVEGDEVSATEKSGERVESEDVDGAVDGQEDKEGPGEIYVGFPSDGPEIWLKKKTLQISKYLLKNSWQSEGVNIDRINFFCICK